MWFQLKPPNQLERARGASTMLQFLYMENSNITTVTKTKKTGLILLLISIGLSIFSGIGLAMYSLSRGCGYDRSFFICSGIGIIFYIVFFINLILIIISIAQLIKPFFAESLIKKVLILYFFIILLVVVFDFFGQSLKSTERECSVVDLYDKKSSGSCYFKLAQNENDISYCSKAGEYEASCNKVMASKTKDVSYCEDQKCIKDINTEKTFENLQIVIEPIEGNQISKNTKNSKIAKVKIVSKNYDGWISWISFGGSSNMTSLITSGSIKFYDEKGKLVFFSDGASNLGIDIKPNTTKYLTIFADTGGINGTVSLELDPIVSVYNPDSQTFKNFNKYNLKANNFVGIPEGYTQQPTHLRSKVELNIR